MSRCSAPSAGRHRQRQLLTCGDRGSQPAAAERRGARSGQADEDGRRCSLKGVPVRGPRDGKPEGKSTCLPFTPPDVSNVR